MVQNLQNSDIEAFFKKIAAGHPAIAHVDDITVRFVGLSASLFDDLNRSGLNWDTMVMVMALPGALPYRFQYQGSGTDMRKSKTFDICIFKTAQNETEQMEACQAAEAVLDDIFTWLRKNDSNPEWPLIDMIDLDNVPGQAMPATGIDGFAGASMRISLRGNLRNTENPLNILMP